MFYTTTTPSTSKMKSDITRMKALLDAKKVDYKEVNLGKGSLVLAGGISRISQYCEKISVV